MSYGLRVRDSNSNIILSMTDRITRLLYVGTAQAFTNGQIEIPGVSYLQTVQFAIGLVGQKAAHTVWKDGNYIKWKYRAYPLISSSDSIIYVFAYT